MEFRTETFIRRERKEPEIPVVSQNNEKEILNQIEALKKQLPRKERKPKRLPIVVSEEEFTALLKQTKKTHHKIAFLLGFGAGLRISEVVSLQPRNVRFAEGSILVEQGKGSKDRTVPIPKGFKEEFLKYLPIKCGVRSLQRAFRGACRRAGILKDKPLIHFHSLRGGFATNCIKNGIPIHHVRTLMGHTNIATTSVYLDVNPKDAIKSYEELF